MTDLAAAYEHVFGHPLPTQPTPWDDALETRIDHAAEQAAQRRDHTWLEGQAADRVHDHHMRRAS